MKQQRFITHRVTQFSLTTPRHVGSITRGWRGRVRKYSEKIIGNARTDK